MVDPVLIFDLDGTVIEVNSFPTWVREMLLGRLSPLGARARVTIGLRCALAVLIRRGLRGSHLQFKRRLQRIWSDATAGEAGARAAHQFTDRLLTHVRPALTPLLREVASGRIDAVLSTAAAAEYALPLAQRLGFRHVLATPAAGSGIAAENAKVIKRDRTLACLEKLGWGMRPRILFTDHRDDLSLMLQCAAVFWLGPAREYDAVSDALAGVPVIAARTLSAHAMHDDVWRMIRSSPRPESLLVGAQP